MLRSTHSFFVVVVVVSYLFILSFLLQPVFPCHHLQIQAQPYIPRSEEWRTASGSIGSAVWEMVPRTVDPNCYDSLDDDAIMKHYLDPPCAGLVAPYLPRQKKSRFQRIRSMLKSAPSSPVPSLPQNDHLLSKSTAIANTAASDKANDAEEETEARLDTHETIVRTVEDMAIGLSSSVCSQASTISSTISEPSASTCTTSTSRDDICDRSTLAAAAAAAAAPQSFLLSSSRLRLAFSRLRSGDQGAQIVAEPARHKCRDVFLNAMKRDSLAGRIRNKLQRPKSATATATPHQKILRSHSMSSIVPYQQRKSDSSDALRRSATATLASTEAQGPKGILRSQPRDGWDRCVCA
ncbi:hypothetical protein BX666DRAFT_1288853 [Dichotomocladium elegans]|nr:hypothetical protein BX666DRAFT_1288853 [Dichotomocladium elegans]